MNIRRKKTYTRTFFSLVNYQNSKSWFYKITNISRIFFFTSVSDLIFHGDFVSLNKTLPETFHVTELPEFKSMRGHRNVTVFTSFLLPCFTSFFLSHFLMNHAPQLSASLSISLSLHIFSATFLWRTSIFSLHFFISVVLSLSLPVSRQKLTTEKDCQGRILGNCTQRTH